MMADGRARIVAGIGLVLAWLTMPIALSGVLLMGAPTLDRLFHPDRHAVRGYRMLPADRFVDLVRRDLPPGARVAAINMPQPGDAVTVTVMPPGAGARGRVYYLDPPTGNRLAVAEEGTGLIWILKRLHDGLGSGPAGCGIAVAFGLSIMVSALTGLYIGWPTGGGWRQVLRHRYRHDRLADLHHLLGLISIGPLFLLALSGIWLACPAMVGRLTGTPPPAWSEPLAARPMAHPAQPLAVVLSRAVDLHPHDAIRSVSWPTLRDPDWTLRFADSRLPPVKVADDTGNATAVSAPDRDVPADWMRDRHDGKRLGPIWRGVTAVAGLASAAMAFTGLILWRRARRRPEAEDASAVIDI